MHLHLTPPSPSPSLSPPGKDLVSILSRQPRLLYCADLPERRERVFAHLVQLHPSKDPRVIGAVVAEHPELLYRMDYYKVRSRMRSGRGM